MFTHVLTVFDSGGLDIWLPEKAWTDADLRGGTPPFLAGDGCNGGTVSTLEELLTDGVVATAISVDFMSLVDGCLQTHMSSS